jgi:hypothetical protein
MNTARSTGESDSSSTRNAIDSESASSACSAGPGSPAGATIGSGSQAPTYVSRRTRADPRWLMPSRVTAVVRYAFTFDTAVPDRLAFTRPSMASCTMSSASPTEPVMPYAMENSSGR